MTPTSPVWYHPSVVEHRGANSAIGVAQEELGTTAENLAFIVEQYLDAGQSGRPSVASRFCSGSSTWEPVMEGCSVLP